MSAYLATDVVIVGIFIILAWTYDLLLGRTGIFSVAHIAFYATGAYAVAILTVNASMSFWTALAVAVLLNAVLSGIVGLLTTRLMGDYLVVATLGLHYVVVSGVLPNWQDVTGGYFGIFGIPKPTVFGVAIEQPWAFAALTLAFVLAVGVLLRGLDRSTLGIALRAVRDDELAATNLGFSPAVLKAVAFVIASSLCVISGGLYATFIGYIDPPTFSISLIILVLAMVVVGGSGTLLGPVLGALLLVALPDLIVFLSRGDAPAVGPIRQIAYGAALIVFVLFRPAGILPASLPRWRKHLVSSTERSA